MPNWCKDIIKTHQHSSGDDGGGVNVRWNELGNYLRGGIHENNKRCSIQASTASPGRGGGGGGGIRHKYNRFKL